MPSVVERASECIVRLGALSLAPQQRYEVTLTAEGIQLQGRQAIEICWSDAVHLLKLPKIHMEPNRKAGMRAQKYWLVVVLEKAFLVGKQQHRCLVMNLGTKAREQPVLGSQTGERAERCSKVLEEKEMAEDVLVTRLFEACLGQKAIEPQESVCALEGAQAWAERAEGVLFPLHVGLIFLPRPALFVPAEDILEAQAGTGRGRRGGDLVIHRACGEKAAKFENIQGGHMTALLAYIGAVATHHRRDQRNEVEEEDEGSDFEVEDLRPAKRRAVTRTCGG